MFPGYDFDNTMLRIGSMNMLLHGVENPDIRYRDSLAQDHAADEEGYTLVLANPPFAGSLDYENTAKGIVVRPASYYVAAGVPALRSLNVKPRRIVLDDLVYFSRGDDETKLKKTRGDRETWCLCDQSSRGLRPWSRTHSTA